MMSKYLALGRLPKGVMNKTESAYSEYLERLRLSGDIIRWRFEPITLNLADRTTYKPDFEVQLSNREIEFHEVKGFWRDDAKVKIKIASRMFEEFRFIAVYKEKDGWRKENFSRG